MSASSEINEKALKLHEDLLAGSLIATAQLAELLLPEISKALTRKFSNINDEHLIQTAANEAVLYYLKSPGKFDPIRGSLIGFVWQKAESTVKNLLKAKKGISEKEESVELPEDRAVYSNEDGETVEQLLIRDEQDNKVFQKLRELLPASSDQAVLELMMDGERETSRFAEILGVSGESSEDQFRVVKKCKDRIKKVIQRRYNRQS